MLSYLSYKNLLLNHNVNIRSVRVCKDNVFMGFHKLMNHKFVKFMNSYDSYQLQQCEIPFCLSKKFCAVFVKCGEECKN